MTIAIRSANKRTGAKQNVTPSLVHWRFVVVLLAIILVFTGLAIRAAYIQVIAPDNLIQQGDNRTLRTRNMPSYRGLITDRNGVELAVSVPVRAIYADPKIIHQQDGLSQTRRWQALAEVLGQDVEMLRSKVINPSRRFVYLQRQVSPAMAEYVEELKIPGIYLRQESRRYYPNGEVTAQLIGITDVDDNGIEGLERLYNDWLTGTPGSRIIRRDAKGRQVEILQSEAGEAAGTVQLTIDQRIQALAYREIKEAMFYYKATSASALVVDVQNGDILAMVNAPSFNPNDRENVSPHRMRNRVITDAFEPGSSLKPLAVLAALEFGQTKVGDIIDTSPGWMRLGGSLVKDFRNYGKLSLEEIIQHSSNMGTSKLALSVPKDFLLDTYYNLGLMSDTGTNMPGEASGIFHERSRWSEFELATLSFGYGISVTTAQLARMYATLANGGIKRPLNIVHKPQSTTWKPQEERVISEHNAKAIIDMMESVTQEDGSGKKAKVQGYRVAGKTGTSRKAVAGGYGEEYVNIFAGLAPLTNPRLVTIVLINEPGGDLYHAGDTAAPVFSKIMGGALQLMNVPPDDRQVTSTQWLKGASNGS
ncbi:peptidoglycan D,D-transpeptidase FtsI family protein [Alteromonas sp. ASW11-130]|uniref:peptidoglycan D,D-transpeptidase FtsI family protein n=1 Tax=Alteromonas sp. ASW11-130 TaxID=3015775 RepID=UPI002241A980|nr:penicillin-binding transpeptidase domain-containing protein [Alteromonas sp. ASW11-130]MCW8091633.1 penicillin-binding transpeptidase domain-containing protein [Alteromonas sp. ASW11-130]